MFITAHQDDCDLATGLVDAIPVGPGSFTDRARLCTCGGILVKVDLIVAAQDQPMPTAWLDIATGGRA